VLPGLTTGWLADRLAGRQAGWQASWFAGRLAGLPADEIMLNLKIFKIIYCIKYSSFCYV